MQPGRTQPSSPKAVEQIETVKTAPGGELLVIGSARLTAYFAAAGVLDELRIMGCAIVLGSGRSLFARGDSDVVGIYAGPRHELLAGTRSRHAADREVSDLEVRLPVGSEARDHGRT
jgi:hypothetical protein